VTTPGDGAVPRDRVGEQAALAAAFDEHAPAVSAFLLRRCESRAAAEDLLSVVFLEAWRCRAKAHEVDGSLRPWLFGIATNVLRNARRATRRHAAALERYHAAHPETAVPDCADDAVRQVDEQRERSALRAALARLPRRERTVVELCLVGDLTAEEAAALLGIPVATVRSRLARARRRLRTDLRPVVT
jgi:RNA polymerase sigma-70 factor (ECF subfamily)